MKNDLVAQKGVCLANSSYLREWFELHEVPVYLETKLKEVKEHSVICTDKTGKEIEIPCDSVIGSVGYLPNPLERKFTWSAIVNRLEIYGAWCGALTRLR